MQTVPHTEPQEHVPRNDVHCNIVVPAGGRLQLDQQHLMHLTVNTSRVLGCQVQLALQLCTH